MKVTDPKNLNKHFNELFRADDLDGMMALYESSAVLCLASGHVLNGSEQIREQMKTLLALRGELTSEHLSCVQRDDLAMLHAKWQFKGSDSAGNAIDIGGYSSKLAKKGEDGAWRYVMDLPVAFRP
ncbi:YybH family protein [Solimicrobium silvestre]|uniref:DUF4440 domain-containing protein n=1 Tax=Solimicrobium silvestre TaxID=2099400 RepID=A0A2S9H258_9BURK|nr:DUF4440 domain-containing protein [Solimicrobium silvestre]PRC94059.1 hypothetical protein S2091_1232 [Solimicrobium silvestre]